MLHKWHERVYKLVEVSSNKGATYGKSRHRKNKTAKIKMNRREYKIIIHIFIILLIIQQNIHTLLNLFIVILIRFLNK